MPPVDPIPALKQQAAAELAREFAGSDPNDLAEFLGIDQPRISDIRRGRLDRFSLERLIRLLARVRRRVELQFSADRSPH